jgi:hypothetical protein
VSDLARDFGGLAGGHEGGRAGAGDRPAAALGGGSLERKLPPVPHLAVLSMALVVVGGIYMASHLPSRPPLGVAVGLLVAAGGVAAANVTLLARIRGFAWASFFLVVRWALLAYFVIAGLLEYVFVLDGTRGASLAVLTCMLALFAVNVPVLMAFTVARYQEPSRP